MKKLIMLIFIAVQSTNATADILKVKKLEVVKGSFKHVYPDLKVFASKVGYHLITVTGESVNDQIGATLSYIISSAGSFCENAILDKQAKSQGSDGGYKLRWVYALADNLEVDHTEMSGTKIGEATRRRAEHYFFSYNYICAVKGNTIIINKK